jgi:hypothetical protein
LWLTPSPRIVAAISVMPTRQVKGRTMFRRLLDTVLRRTPPPASPAPSPSGDYARDRERDRRGQLSPEDRDWETASRQRNEENQARTEAGRDPLP